ncbi:MAG: M20/M25/M40 family metallo-hydrolase [Sulfolobales archaeon]|nr:M20/M25/M40 family metallo-hydrolase [Sulfolobales archaeon]MDW8082707.1 M20/M25/M40 family metallo-hydrolase [Sulfolobales archaeon]
MESNRVSQIKSKSLKFIEENYGKYLNILRELVSYRSVAAWKSEELEACANHIADLLRERGFRVYLKSAGGSPAVFAEVGSGSRTILIYNHYDVQPPDPLELWESDPFKLTAKNELLFGRGTADNKGNIAARIGALDSLLNHLEELDVRVKFLIEGEEEVGSPTIFKLVKENFEWVKADGGIWETGYVRRDGSLGISLGFKGMLYVEVLLKGPSRDVHSGTAPLVPNPVWRMARLLQSLKTEDGLIKVPGFHDDIDEEFLREAEELIKNLCPSELEELKKELSLREFVRGLSGVEALRELYTKPSLNVSGLYSGYTGRGSKTIVPSVAGVKIDIRPVPGQKPEKILENLRKYLNDLGFSDAEVVVHSMYPSGYTKPSEAIVRASVEAAVDTYGRSPELTPLSGGSGPIYVFTNIARIPMTGAGVGYYGSRVHAPNENIRISDFVLSMKHVALTLLYFTTKYRPQ